MKSVPSKPPANSDARGSAMPCKGLWRAPVAGNVERHSYLAVGEAR
jgi:hypothetical protein